MGGRIAGQSRAKLSHVDSRGRVRMVDVINKPVTDRVAVARGRIKIGEEALRAVRDGRIAKGDPLQTARVAGIMAAKRTSELVPLCHPLTLANIDVRLRALPDGYAIEASAKTADRTGVEMEALTIYDMVKALDKRMVIGEIRLVEKRGGRSGTFKAS